jgi:hypothetical protein
MMAFRGGRQHPFVSNLSWEPPTMCAKKATSPAPRKTAAATVKTVAANKSAANGKAIPVAVAPPAKERALSQNDIGMVAGEVWSALADVDALTIAALKKAVSAPGDVVVAAVGWLAREHKLEFNSSGRSLKIALKR